jgi:hypothetical protein
MSAAQARQSRLIVVCDTAKVRAMAVNCSYRAVQLPRAADRW